MNPITFYKFSNNLLIIFITSCIFFIGCNDDISNSISIEPNFSLGGEEIFIEECKIIKGEKENDLYIFFVELKDKNDKLIFLKLYSINNTFSDNFYRDYTYGSAPNEYSPESYVKEGTSTNYLSNGDISITINYINFKGADIRITIKCETLNGHSIEGCYEGKYDYFENSNKIENHIPIGNGSFSFSYTNKTYPLDCGFLFYYGFDPNLKKRTYKLFLSNKEREYLQFFFSSNDILGANLDKSIYKYPKDEEYFYQSQSSSWMIHLGKEWYIMNEGHIGIKKANKDNYNVSIECGYNIYTYFSIEGAYSGSLTYFDFSNDLINYKGKDYEIESVDLTYEGQHKEYYKYKLLIRTTSYDNIDLKLFSKNNMLSEYNLFSEIYKEIPYQDIYDSFITISNESPIGFWHTGEITIDSLDKETSSAKFDFSGKDETGNLINIIYHGKINLKL